VGLFIKNNLEWGLYAWMVPDLSQPLIGMFSIKTKSFEKAQEKLLSIIF
jgi:hypothetical protein